MTYSKFPPDVVDFIIEHIHSIEQLDVLLLLREKADTAWDVDALNKIIRTSAESLSNRLTDLHNRALIVREGDQGQFYRYRPGDKALDETIGRLAGVYKNHRPAVIELVFSKPIREMHSFSSAFRFKKENKDG